MGRKEFGTTAPLFLATGDLPFAPEMWHAESMYNRGRNIIDFCQWRQYRQALNDNLEYLLDALEAICTEAHQVGDRNVAGFIHEVSASIRAFADEERAQSASR